MDKTDYSVEFEAVTNSLKRLIEEVKKKKLNLKATDQWTVKQVLSHLVFWHENYAANYQALATNQKPPLFEDPGYLLNQKSVELTNLSTAKLVRRLEDAHSSLYKSIVVRKVPRMTYKKNGRVYTTSEFLDVVSGHLLTHTKQIKRAK